MLFCKLVEKAVSDPLYALLNLHDLCPIAQFADRKHHSAETALLRVRNDQLMAMDRQHVSLLVLLDVNAAFDTLDRNILLNTLESRFRIYGSTLKWFSSYLSGRSQQVSITGRFNLEFGVPQGSCLCNSLCIPVHCSVV